MKLMHVLVSISCLLCIAFLPILRWLDPYGNAWSKELILPIIILFIAWVIINLALVIFWVLEKTIRKQSEHA